MVSHRRGPVEPSSPEFTDLVEPDPYVVVSAGRRYLGLKDLLGLVDLLRESGAGRREGMCKDIYAASVRIFMPVSAHGLMES